VASSIFTYRCSGIQNVKMVWRQRSYVTNNVDQQTLKSYDDYVLPHQLLWTFDVLVCPLSVTERFLLQPVVCGTVFHRTSLLPPLSIFCCHLKSHLFLLSYPTFWLSSHLYSARHFGHYNSYYILLHYYKIEAGSFICTSLWAMLLLNAGRVQQITAASMTGPKADEFRLKVKQAATGHPWYTHEPSNVSVNFLESRHIATGVLGQL